VSRRKEGNERDQSERLTISLFFPSIRIDFQLEKVRYHSLLPSIDFPDLKAFLFRGGQTRTTSEKTSSRLSLVNEQSSFSSEGKLQPSTNDLGTRSRDAIRLLFSPTSTWRIDRLRRFWREPRESESSLLVGFATRSP